MVEPISFVVGELHGHWAGDHSKCRPEWGCQCVVAESGTISVSLPDPGYVLIIANDGDVHGIVPVSRALLADVAPMLDAAVTRGLEMVRRG